MDEAGVMSRMRMRQEDALEERRPRSFDLACGRMAAGRFNLFPQVRRGINEPALAAARVGDEQTRHQPLPAGIRVQLPHAHPIWGRPPSCAVPRTRIYGASSSVPDASAGWVKPAAASMRKAHASAALRKNRKNDMWRTLLRSLFSRV